MEKDMQEERTTLGDSMKELEFPFTSGAELWSGEDTEYIGKTRVTPGKWCIIRVDGRAFHTYTRKFKERGEPFSPVIEGAMEKAVMALIDEFLPSVAYQQSDEITLAIDPKHVTFGRKCHKLCSIAASVATAAFNDHIHCAIGHQAKLAVFDARAYEVTREQAAATLLWRQLDCVKNSVSTLARAYFSQKQLDGKKTEDKMDMLWKEKGIMWGLMSYRRRYGLIARPSTRTINVSDNREELERMGYNEKAIENIMKLGGTVTRSCVDIDEQLPPFSDIANLPDVLFDRAEPELRNPVKFERTHP